MKKTFFLRFAVIFTALVLVLSGCPEDTGPGGDDKKVDDPIAVTLQTVTADGGGGAPTTKLTLTFSAAIPGLTAADITLGDPNSTGIQKGLLVLVSGGTYDLFVNNIAADGDVTVSAAKTGFTISGSPKTVGVFRDVAAIPVTFESVEANGGEGVGTTKLTLTFSVEITGLNAADITLGDPNTTGIQKGALIHIEDGEYELGVSNIASDGEITVSVGKAGYIVSGSPKTVDVFYDETAIEVTFVSVTANGGSGTETTLLTLTFSEEITGLLAADIAFDDTNETGIQIGALTPTSGGVYELVVSGITATGDVDVLVSKAGYIITGSPQTVEVFHTFPPIAGNVYILNEPIVGNTLTLYFSPMIPVATYQWVLGTEDIDGATGLTYLVKAEDAGQRISVRVERPSYTGSLTAQTDPVFWGYRVEQVPGARDHDWKYVHKDGNWTWDWVARFARARGLVIAPNGDLLVAMEDNGRRDFYVGDEDRSPQDGRILRVANPSGSDNVTMTQFANVWSTPFIAIHPTSAEIYVTRIWGKDARKYPVTGGVQGDDRDDGERIHPDVDNLVSFGGGNDNALGGSLAVHSDGTVYVVDTYNHRILKILANGTVSVLAGGSKGRADGTGAAAQFNEPEGVAVDAEGNVFVADTWNGTIRKITPDGVVTTFAGGIDWAEPRDGFGTDARFRLVKNITFAPDGNFYITEADNDTGHFIRKLTPEGIVTTIAGTPGSDTRGDENRLDNGRDQRAKFENPFGIAMSQDGIIYVLDNADSNHGRVRRIIKQTTAP